MQGARFPLFICSLLPLPNANANQFALAEQIALPIPFRHLRGYMQTNYCLFIAARNRPLGRNDHPVVQQSLVLLREPRSMLQVIQCLARMTPFIVGTDLRFQMRPLAPVARADRIEDSVCEYVETILQMHRDILPL